MSTFGISGNGVKSSSDVEAVGDQTTGGNIASEWEEMQNIPMGGGENVGEDGKNRKAILDNRNQYNARVDALVSAKEKFGASAKEALSQLSDDSYYDVTWWIMRTLSETQKEFGYELIDNQASLVVKDGKVDDYREWVADCRGLAKPYGELMALDESLKVNEYLEELALNDEVSAVYDKLVNEYKCDAKEFLYVAHSLVQFSPRGEEFRDYVRGQLQTPGAIQNDALKKFLELE